MVLPLEGYFFLNRGINPAHIHVGKSRSPSLTFQISTLFHPRKAHPSKLITISLCKFLNPCATFLLPFLYPPISPDLVLAFHLCPALMLQSFLDLFPSTWLCVDPEFCLASLMHGNWHLDIVLSY